MILSRLSKIAATLALAASAVFSLTGCGGGGGGGTASIAGGASAIITDDLNTGYDHVWVTIKSVDLVSASGTTNIYSNSTGDVVDLKTLRDANGNRFLFLNTSPIPAGTYTGVNVTVANGVSIYPTGATTATAATFQTTGDFVLPLTFAKPKTTNGSKDEIVIDFNLANWVLTGTSVTAPGNAFLSEGPAANLGDGSRWEAHLYRGTVNSLAGTVGSQTFSLSGNAGAPVVQTTATTAVYNSDGSASPALANGQSVIVQGTYSSTTSTITAVSVEIIVTPANQNIDVVGAVSNISTSAFTFQVTPHECDRFQPDQSVLTVNTSSTTLFYGTTGTTYTQADFFAALAAGAVADVQGTVTSGVITATQVKLVSAPSSGGGGGGGDGGFGNLVRVQGTSGALSTTASTFTVTKQVWEGFWGQNSVTFTILFNSSTAWTQQGQTITEAAAETLIGTGAKANIRGTYDATSQQITAVKVDFPPAGGGH